MNGERHAVHAPTRIRNQWLQDRSSVQPTTDQNDQLSGTETTLTQFDNAHTSSFSRPRQVPVQASEPGVFCAWRMGCLHVCAVSNPGENNISGRCTRRSALIKWTIRWVPATAKTRVSFQCRLINCIWQNNRAKRERTSCSTLGAHCTRQLKPFLG